MGPLDVHQINNRVSYEQFPLALQLTQIGIVILNCIRPNISDRLVPSLKKGKGFGSVADPGTRKEGPKA